MKITLIGAGSHVFGPTVLQDALQHHRLQGWSLALVDLDREAADLMAALGKRMAAELGVDCAITAHQDRLEALPGSDFVILCACPQGERRWTMDCAVLAAAGLPGQRRECGGLGGLSYSLRSIGLALDIAADMARLCPRALLLDATNPMPRVVTAVNRFSPIRAYGFCNAAYSGPLGYDREGRYRIVNPSGFAGLGVELGRDSAELEAVVAGLNHFAWLVSVRDRRTGEDLTDAVLDSIRRRTDDGAEVLKNWLADYGALAMSGPHHQGEYMPPHPRLDYGHASPFHGAGETGRIKRDLLRAAARGDTPWPELMAHGSWEHPVTLAAAWAGGGACALPLINLPNDGVLPGLPAGRIVEAPARAGAGSVSGTGPITLPGKAGALCRQVSEVHELVAAGAALGSREKLADAIEADPAIPEKNRALSALDPLLLAHRDILSRFA